LVSINGALLPLDGWAGQIFSPLAKMLAKAPLVPELFSWRAAQADVLQKLLDGTGSRLDTKGRALYRQLIANPGHAGAALAMMAHWDLHTLERDLPALPLALTLVAGAQDVIVPPAVAHRVAALLRQASARPVQVLQGLGHLAHEEQPGAIAPLVLAAHA
jgi:magnesium chelatase accessory protein